MDRTEDQEKFETWLQETWSGSDPFSFLMRARYNDDQYFGVSAISAIEKRGYLLPSERLSIDDEIDRIRQ